MARERRLHRHVCRETVADFADDDDVRVLADDGTQRFVECQADLFVDRALRDAVNDILHRVFAGDDLHRRIVAKIYRAIERRRFSRTRRPGNQRDARRRSEHIFAIEAQDVRRKAKLLQADERSFVEDSQDDIFAEDRRIERDANINLLLFGLDEDAAILMLAALGDIGVGQNLDARDNARRVIAREIHLVNQHAVNAVAHAQLVGHRLKMHVGCAFFNGRANQLIDHLHDAVVIRLRLGFERVVFDFVVIGDAGIFALLQRVNEFE